jgi:hypothetical protein
VEVEAGKWRAGITHNAGGGARGVPDNAENILLIQRF